MLLGGGRQKAEDQLDYAVGIELYKKVGDAVNEGDDILMIYSNREDVTDVVNLLDQSIEIGSDAEEYQMIYKTVE